MLISITTCCYRYKYCKNTKNFKYFDVKYLSRRYVSQIRTKKIEMTLNNLYRINISQVTCNLR